MELVFKEEDIPQLHTGEHCFPLVYLVVKQKRKAFAKTATVPSDLPSTRQASTR